MFILTAVLLVGALCFAARAFSSKPTSGQHLDHVDWLPSTASNVSFYRNGDPLFPVYCYECTIPYESLLQLAKEEGWKLSAKSSVHLSSMRDALRLPRLKIEGSSNENNYPTALEYITEQSNGGGIQVVYHRPSARLFVYYTSN